MYFYHDGENEVGPFAIDKLQSLAEGGLIGPGTLVRSDKSDGWRRLDAVLALADGEPLETPAPEWQPAPETGPADTVTAAPDVEPAAMRAEPAAAPVAPPVDKRGWSTRPVAPWRRYGARMLDTTVNGVLGFFLVGIAFYTVAPASADAFFSIFETGGGVILDIILTAAIASLVGGILIGATGLSLGKLTFGVKVTRADGGKLGVGAGISRDFSVLFAGLGLGIPLIAFITMIVAYARLKDTGSTRWDNGRYLVWHRPGGAAQTLLNIIGIILIIVVSLLVQAMADL